MESRTTSEQQADLQDAAGHPALDNQAKTGETEQQKEQAMSKQVLIVSTMDGAENCARAIAENVGVRVDVAQSRRAALLALRREPFDVVVVEESLVEADPEWADLMWELAGMAMPMQINFAIAGCARLSREIKAALLRKDGEKAMARLAATTEIENELKSSITGLLLESELALREPSVPAALAPKLRHLVELAGELRERLRRPPAKP